MMKKIAFVHYSFKEDGVTRVVLNNSFALSDMGYDISLVSESFSENLPEFIHKKKLSFDTDSLEDTLSKFADMQKIAKRYNKSIKKHDKMKVVRAKRARHLRAKTMNKK